MASENEIVSSIRLINTSGIGTVKFYQLVEEFSSAEKAVDFLEKKTQSKSLGVLSRLKKNWQKPISSG